MRTPRRTFVIPTAAVFVATALSACGSNSAGQSATIAPSATALESAAAVPPASSTRPNLNTPVVIKLSVGTDTGSDRREVVRHGQTVTIEAVNPNADEEYHIHDYDLGAGNEVPKGQTASFTFVADRTGEFELESHVTDTVLMVLVVEP